MIEAGAVVDRCIIDKKVTIGAGAKVGDGDDNQANETLAEELNTGLTLVGKGSVIPAEYDAGTKRCRACCVRQQGIWPTQG